jgi:hypothetical protein
MRVGRDFSLIAEVLSPKAFSGSFSTAPSVAFASLALTVSFESVEKAQLESIGMVLGGIGMVVSCAGVTVAIPRFKGTSIVIVSWVAWAIAAVGLYWGLFVGAS